MKWFIIKVKDEAGTNYLRSLIVRARASNYVTHEKMHLAEIFISAVQAQTAIDIIMECNPSAECTIVQLHVTEL